MQSRFLLFALTILCLIFSCQKDDFLWNLKKAPEVGYLSVVSNEVNEFKLSVECISTGYSKNVEMGFCWSINPNPTIADSIIQVEKTNEGIFTSIVPWTSLSSYHFRAFVKNEMGIVYSQDCIVLWPGAPNLPQVQTINTDQISFYSFNTNCTVLSTGGNSIIQKGVYLYNSANGISPVATKISNSIMNDYSITFDGLTDGTTYYLRAFATTLAGTSMGNLVSVTLPKKYAIGEIGPAGGLIFYENPDQFGTWHYLEVAPNDIPGAQVKWSPNNVQTNVTSVDLGNGVSNTNSIISIFGNSNSYASLSAFNWSNNGFTDWVLPSFNELKLLKEIFFDQGIGNFNSEMKYWSSSEDSNYDINAWTVKMSATNQNLYTTSGKNQLLRIRAIRRF